MHLLPDEHILLESDSKALRVTTHRVRYHTTAWGSADLVSIMLEEVASCGMLQRSFPLLLVLAALAFVVFLVGQFGGAQVAAVGLRDPGTRGIAVLAAVICVVGYLITRVHILSIRSAGDGIRIRMSGMKTEQVVKLIEQIEVAKNARFRGNHAATSSVRVPDGVSLVPSGALQAH